MLSKGVIFNAVVSEVNKRINTIQEAFDDINASLTSATKSSAGDKHETGRAMAQLEQEKLSKQMDANMALKNALSKIDPTVTHHNVQFGSLVITTMGNYYLSVGIGKINVDGTDVFCISAVTPLGRALLTKQANDQVNFNGTNYRLLEVI